VIDQAIQLFIDFFSVMFWAIPVTFLILYLSGILSISVEENEGEK